MSGSLFSETQRRFIERHLSLIVLAAALFAFGATSLILSLTKEESEAHVEIKSPMASLRILRGQRPEQNVFEFTVKDRPQVFVVSGLRIVDQNILASAEKPGNLFTFTVGERGLAGDAMRLPVHSLSSPANVYLAPDMGAALAAKDQMILTVFALLCIVGGVIMTLRLRKAAAIDTGPISSVDPVLVWVARQPRKAVGLCLLGNLLPFSLFLGFIPALYGSVACYGGFLLWYKMQNGQFAWLQSIADRDREYQLKRQTRPETEVPKHLKAIQLLVAAEKVNAQDQTGRTALHIAARAGHTDAVALLLKAGADPNLADSEGNTPILLAAKAGSLGMVMKLVEGGAIANSANNLGENAVEIAKASKHRGLADFLSRTKARQELDAKKAAEKAAMESARLQRAQQTEAAKTSAAEGAQAASDKAGSDQAG